MKAVELSKLLETSASRSEEHLSSAGDVLERAWRVVDESCPACIGAQFCEPNHWGEGTQDALSLLSLARYVVEAEADYIGALDRLRKDWHPTKKKGGA